MFFASVQGTDYLPKIKLAVSNESVEVTPTGSVTELTVSDIKLVPDSAAAALAVPGKEFLWKPSELASRTTGGADIYATHLTSDGSAAVICERVGGFGNPSGLRIAVIDIASGKVIRVTDVFQYDAIYTQLVGDAALFAVAAPSGRRGDEYCFVKINLVSGEAETSEKFQGTPDGAVVGNGKVYTLSSAEKTVSVYDLETFEKAAECKVKNPSAKGLGISPDGRVLAVFGEKNVELYNGKVNNKTLYLRRTFSVADGDFTRCAFADERGKTMVFFSPGKSAYVLMNDTLVPLPDMTCGEVFAANYKSGNFILENRLREFSVYRFPKLTAVEKYAPRKMRPISRNDNTALFFLPGKKAENLLLADHRGNLWKLEFKGKRGKKYPVLTVDDTGIRKR